MIDSVENRSGLRWLWCYLGLLTLGILAGCESGPEHQALGTLERDLIRFTAPASEIITEVYVEEGDTVARGEPLMQLDDRATRAEVARAAAELTRAQAYLRQLQNGSREEELAAARARVDNAKATAGAAEKAFRRTEALVKQNLLGPADLDNARASRDSARAALQEAREQLLLLEHGTREELLEQARAEVEASTQALAIAEKRVADMHITATRSGRIDALPWKQGERVTAGAIIIVLVAAENPYVRAYAPESVKASLKVGTRLLVNIDGVGRTFSGRLTHVQQAPAFSPHYALTEEERSRLMYLIKVQLDDSAADIPNGVPAQVLFATQDAQ